MRRANGLRLGRAPLAQVDREHGHRPDREEFDCQFWSERSQKSAPVTYWSQPTACSPCSRRSALRAPVVQRLPAPREQEDRGHREDEEFSYQKRPAPSPVGGALGAFGAQRRPSARDRPSPMSSSRFDSFDPLHEPAVARMKSANWSELRLPVLEHGAPEVGREHVVEPGQRSPVVRELVGAARCPANDCPTSAATKIAPKKSDSLFSTGARFNRPPARPRSREREPRGSAANRTANIVRTLLAFPAVPESEPRGIQSADATAESDAAVAVAAVVVARRGAGAPARTGRSTSRGLARGRRRRRRRRLHRALDGAGAAGARAVPERRGARGARDRRRAEWTKRRLPPRLLVVARDAPRRARRRRGAPARMHRAGSSPPCAPSSSSAARTSG